MKRPPERISRTATPPEAEIKAIQRKAAEWLALRQARTFTPAEHASFAEWCAADRRHAAVFAEVEAAWRAFDKLADYPHAMDLPADPDLLVPRRPAGSVWRPAVRVGVAAAAAVVLASALWMRPWTSADSAGRPEQVAHNETRLVHLSDGSEVELNAGSDLVQLFTADERRVRLVRGEAHFTVAKDAAHPFVVEAHGVAVRAVGTAFDVRIDPTAVHVLVTEGRVHLAPSAKPVAASGAPVSPATVREVEAAFHPADLTAGQRAVVPTAVSAQESAGVVVENVPPAEIERTLAWQSKQLLFDSTPLAEAVAKFNEHLAGRSRAIRLTLGDDRVGAVLVSGRIRTDNVASFVDVLESSFPVTAERRAGGEIVLKSKP